MRDYISPCDVFHTPDVHMAKFPALCDYIQQGQSQQAHTHKKWMEIYGCE
jgi:hypothetical protein